MQVHILNSSIQEAEAARDNIERTCLQKKKKRDYTYLLCVYMCVLVPRWACGTQRTTPWDLELGLRSQIGGEGKCLYPLSNLTGPTISPPHLVFIAS